MPSNQDKAALKRVLDLCQRVQEVTDALSAGPPPSRRKRLRARHQQLVSTLLDAGRGGAESGGLPDLIREVAQHASLDERELALFLFLLEHRISCSEPELEGRELLQCLSGSAFDLLKHSALLHAGSRLVSSGLVRARLQHPEAALEGQFRISERFFRRFQRRYHGRNEAPAENAEPSGYDRIIDHFLDLYQVSNLIQKRAAVVFPQSYWIDVHPDVEDGPSDLEEAVTLAHQVVRMRERRTVDVDLPLVKLREEFSLDADEEVIVATLLFQELFASSPVIEAAELVRLVSGAEAEVFAKRHLLAPQARLRDSGIVIAEPEYEEKAMLAGLFLSEWSTERLLNQVDMAAGIRQEERNRFHDFLEGLDNSEDFYRNL